MNLSLSHFKENRWLLLWGFLGYSFGLFILKSSNPYFLLISFSLPLSLILITHDKICFYLILFSIFFADWFKELGLIPDQMTWLPDAILVLLTVKVIILRITRNKKFVVTPLGLPILLFIFVGFLSMLVNSGNVITTILSFRQDLRFVLMFFILVNLNLGEQFFRQMIVVFIILLLIQVPVALAKLTVYGQGESAIGTYGVHGGTYSTILPLVSISIFLGFFLFEKPRLRYVCCILLFIVFSIVGGKRAFVFFAAFLSLFLFLQAEGKNRRRLSLIAPILIPGFLACVYFVPSLRPAFENPRHIIDFPISYSTSYVRGTNKAAGRMSAIKETYAALKENASQFLLGFGPGSMTKSFFKEFGGNIHEKTRIDYGGTQWVTMSLEYGYVGAVLFLCLLVPLFRMNQRFFSGMNDKFWKSISFGYKGILLTYLMGFFYGRVFRLDVLAFIFWFFSAVIFSVGREKNYTGKDFYGS